MANLKKLNSDIRASKRKKKKVVAKKEPDDIVKAVDELKEAIRTTDGGMDLTTIEKTLQDLLDEYRARQSRPIKFDVFRDRNGFTSHVIATPQESGKGK